MTEPGMPAPGETPSERIWRVPCFLERIEVEGGEPQRIIHPETGMPIPTPQAVTEAFGDLHSITMRLGGIVAVAAEREQTRPGVYETTGYTFRWQSFVPAKKKSSPNGVAPKVEAPAPEAEAVASSE